MTWRRGLWALAVLLNILYAGFWMVELVRFWLEADLFGPEAFRAEFTEYAVMVAIPAISLVALLWPPTHPAPERT